MLRQGLGGCGRVPRDLLFTKGIAEDEQLAHSGGEHHLEPLSRHDEPPIKDSGGWIGAWQRGITHSALPD